MEKTWNAELYSAFSIASEGKIKSQNFKLQKV